MLVAGVAVTAGAEVAIGPLAVGRTAAMGLDAAPAADDVLGLQADGAGAGVHADLIRERIDGVTGV